VALLQALITLISRSAGKILNAMFGWAVVALFGRTSRREKTVLSALVGLAAAWPVLLLGVFMPRFATAVMAFVPPSAQGPAWVMRVVWVSLAVLVPTAVGLAVAAKAPPGSPREPRVKRVLRGFPITVGLAAAFLLTFLTVPVLRIVSLVRRRKDEHVPLVTDAAAYEVVAARIDRTLARHGLGARRARPPWWLSSPTRILQALGGRSFRGFVPDRMAYWSGPRLQIALYPNDLMVRGAGRDAALTHGLVVEDLVRSPALQTLDPAAQAIERRIREAWTLYAATPAPHARARTLYNRLWNVTEDLLRVDVPYEEWSILYRQCAQLGRALDGRPQLLASPALGLGLATRPSAARAAPEPDVPAAAPRDRGIGAVTALTAAAVALVAAAALLASAAPVWSAVLAVAGGLLGTGAVTASAWWRHPAARARSLRSTTGEKEEGEWLSERTA
jgi:hypothetical protein